MLMNILILGGSGTLSGRIAHLAVEMGHQVWAVTRGIRPLPAGVHPLQADRNSEDEMRAALKNAPACWDGVIDSICFSADQALLDQRLFSGKAKQLVMVSTDSVYHPDFKQVPQDESNEHYLTDDGYGANKRRAEEIFIAGGDALPYTIFRPGHIYGPGFQLGCYPDHTRQKDLLSHMRSEQPIVLAGGGEFIIHPIFVDDLARCILAALGNEKAMNQIFCIGGGDYMTNRAYFSAIGELIGHPVHFQARPLSDYADRPEYSGHLCQRCYKMDKLRQAGLPLPMTTLKEGLAAQIAWLDAQG